MEKFVVDIGLGAFLKTFNADQERDDHGRWTSGNSGGTSYTRRQMLFLNQSTDRYKRSVYGAENSTNGEKATNVRGTMEKPTAPKYPQEAINEARNNKDVGKEWTLRLQYEKNYKTYSSAFNKYAMDFKSVDIQSELGTKYLDGTKEGTGAYVKDIINQGWFVKAYGNGGEMGQPSVRLSNAKGYAGQYSSGITKNIISISNPYSQDEPVILHEVAHYAQTVSAVGGYEAHGVGFAEINLNLVDHVVGNVAADRLASAYIKNGVPVAKL